MPAPARGQRERPIGASRCDHFAGLPIRDSREGIQRILAAWTDGFDCRGLTCLEAR